MNIRWPEYMVDEIKYWIDEIVEEDILYIDPLPDELFEID